MSPFASRIILLACASSLVATPAGAAALYRATILTDRNDSQPIVQGLDSSGRILFWTGGASSSPPIYNPQDGTTAPMVVEQAGVRTYFIPLYMSGDGRTTIGFSADGNALYHDGRITKLPATGQAVNDSGQVAVTISAPIVDLASYKPWSTTSLVSDGRVTPLGVLPGYDGTMVSSLNNSGQGAGAAAAFPKDGEFRSEPVYYDGLKYVPLGTFGGPRGGASGINNKGDVIGVATDASNREIGFVSHQGGPLVPLYASGGNISTVEPSSINDTAQIVGRMMDGDIVKAFMHENGVLTDLNKLLSPSANIRLVDAYFINNLSQIVAKGYLPGEELPRLFLLTPEDQPMPKEPKPPLLIVPEPGTLVVFALVFAGAAATRRRRKAA